MKARIAIAWLVTAVLVLPAGAWQAPARPPDIDYVPTPQEVVDAMLKLAGVTAKDIIYDLGSGDGRIPITAAKTYGARGVGIDIQKAQVESAVANAKAAGVSDKVRFLNEDLFKANISEATVVTLYLLPDLNLKLLPKLNAELKPGTRVLSHSFDMGDAIKPKQTLRVGGRVVFLFVVPIK
ncbi:MAG TPA: methyltransferase domain-containing protein [Vicinamibacterales bacterium]|nr:methyltransferase domain-containing protein [Vicinamibacterales bacterium]